MLIDGMVISIQHPRAQIGAIVIRSSFPQRTITQHNINLPLGTSPASARRQQLNLKVQLVQSAQG